MAFFITCLAAQTAITITDCLEPSNHTLGLLRFSGYMEREQIYPGKLNSLAEKKTFLSLDRILLHEISRRRRLYQQRPRNTNNTSTRNAHQGVQIWKHVILQTSVFIVLFVFIQHIFPPECGYPISFSKLSLKASFWL